MKKKDLPKIWVILGLGVLLFGCATTDDVKILDRETDRLYAQVKTNQKEIESLKGEFSGLRAEIQSEMSKLQNDEKVSKADLLLRLENLQSEVRVLTAGVEEYKDFARKPSKEIDRMKEDVAFRTRILEEKWKTFEEKTKAQEDQIKSLEERNRGLEGQLKAIDSKAQQVASKQQELEKADQTRAMAPAEVKLPATGAAGLYKDAYETFQRGDPEDARQKFETFLRQYPNTELSDNAQFWIGETYYQKKDYEKAILEYEKVIVKYPEGEKVSSALFKQGLAFLELGDKTNARNLLKRVIDRYPQSEQAEMARKKLETLK
jgi:tol-pal system protein YbgF